jgi:hypothetical protein
MEFNKSFNWKIEKNYYKLLKLVSDLFFDNYLIKIISFQKVKK